MDIFITMTEFTSFINQGIGLDQFTKEYNISSNN